MGDVSMGYLDVAARRGTVIIARRDLGGSLGADEETRQELEFEVGHALSDAEFRVFAVPGALFDVELKVGLHHR